MFYSPRGEMTFEGRWQPPALPDDPVAALIETHERLGIAPDGWTACARWKGEVPTDVYARALDALL